MSTKQTETNRSALIWIGVGVVVVIGLFVWAIMAGGATSSSGTSYEVEAFGDVDVTGDLLPILDPGNVGIAELDPAAGLPAPVATGTDYDGVASSIGDADGPQLLVFLAHWCPHCQAELPHLVDLAEDGAFDGMEAVVVLTGTNPTAPNFPPLDWLQREGWDGTVLVDEEDQAAGAAYGLSSYPYLVLVGEDGRVVARVAGEQGMERLRAFVQQAG